MIAAKGAGAPPKITLVGPKGERISTPDDLMPVEAKPFFLMKNPQAEPDPDRDLQAERRARGA